MKLALIFSVTAVFLGALPQAEAATVQFSTPPAVITAGQSFSLDILASEFPEILGGGLSISVSDPSVLRIDSATFNSAFWDAAFSQNATPNPAAGTASNLGFGKFAGASGSFTIGTLALTALTTGNSNISLAEDGFNGGFVFSGDAVPISFNPTAVNVQSAAVPVPAAVWLFASALGAVFFGTGRKANDTPT